VGSLCRELVHLRERARQLAGDQARCRDARLFGRLRGELLRLEARRRELQSTVAGLKRGGLRDALALAFLAELSRRPLVPVGSA
jgi:hypothetical protein